MFLDDAQCCLVDNTNRAAQDYRSSFTCLCPFASPVTGQYSAEQYDQTKSNLPLLISVTSTLSMCCWQILWLIFLIANRIILCVCVSNQRLVRAEREPRAPDCAVPICQLQCVYRECDFERGGRKKTHVWFYKLRFSNDLPRTWTKTFTSQLVLLDPRENTASCKFWIEPRQGKGREVYGSLLSGQERGARFQSSQSRVKLASKSVPRKPAS